MSFSSLGLAPALVSRLDSLGYQEPTPVQTAAIPQALDGVDLMVSAQTGSGKTAAFMLPTLHRLLHQSAPQNGVAVLVLTPTRELAQQVGQATQSYSKGKHRLTTAVVVGGTPYRAQIRALAQPVDVLVATPGRLMDHLQAGRLSLDQVQTLILDEADRMLDMGFINDIRRIVAQLPKQRQNLLFSATLDGTVAKLAAEMMHNPKTITIATAQQNHEHITQSLLYADDRAHKMQLLQHLLQDSQLNQAIIFTATKRGADRLARQLSRQGLPTGALHGDMNQRQRTRTLAQLQQGRLRLLVATDVAARGIDVPGISHAINFDLPMHAEDYTHRIGRTGRAGKHGQAITLAEVDEHDKVRRIERFIGQPIPVNSIDGLEATKEISVRAKRQAKRPYKRRPAAFKGARKPRTSHHGQAAKRSGRSGARARS